MGVVNRVIRKRKNHEVYMEIRRIKQSIVLLPEAIRQKESDNYI